MPNRKLELTLKYLTASQVRQRLGLSRFQFDIRIDRGIFPRPTFVDTTGVRYFDENWIRIAQAIIESAPNTSPVLKKQAETPREV